MPVFVRVRVPVPVAPILTGFDAALTVHAPSALFMVRLHIAPAPVKFMSWASEAWSSVSAVLPPAAFAPTVISPSTFIVPLFSTPSVKSKFPRTSAVPDTLMAVPFLSTKTSFHATLPAVHVSLLPLVHFNVPPVHEPATPTTSSPPPELMSMKPPPAVSLTVPAV